jgi:hypothetical protein
LVSGLVLGFAFFALNRWLEPTHYLHAAVFWHYTSLMRSGAVPYRDFAFEYPPAALPVFLLPAYMHWSYATSFAILMGVCGAGCLALLATTLRTVQASGARIWASLLLFSVSPLVLGSLFDTRFDLWPTLLALGGIAALVKERPVLSGALLGLGFAAKLWPAALVPLAAVYLWRRRDRGAASAAVLAFVVSALLCFLPFAVLAPHGLWSSVSGQLDRPLQVESLGAALLMAAQHLGMHLARTVTAHGSQALKGGYADVAANLSTAAELVAVAAIGISYARRRTAEHGALLMAAAATVVALVAFDKVLSPQYLIWLVPFVALASGAAGLIAAGLLLVSLRLTQTWYPANWRQLARFHASPWSWFLLTRDLALVAAGAALFEGLRRWPRARVG